MEMQEETTHPVAVVPTGQSLEEERLRMETSSRSKTQSHTSQAATKVVKRRKRKLHAVSVEARALSPTNNIQSNQDGNLGTSLSTSKKAISKKILDKAVSVSKAVRARKRNVTLTPTNQMDNYSLTPTNQMDNHSSSPLTATSPVAKKNKNRRSRSLTSNAWNHFHESDDNDEEPTAVCIHCGKEYLCKSSHGTSNLWKHLRFQCPAEPLKDQDMRKKGPGTPKQCYSYDAYHKSLVEMIIIDEMAFRAVEGEGFIRYSNTLQPRFEIPSRTTVARDAMRISRSVLRRKKFQEKNFWH